MMSQRDAVRSYRRQFRRVFGRRGRGTLVGATPELTELCRRGDRLWSVYHDVDNWPTEVHDAYTSRDLAEIRSIPQRRL